MTVFTTEITSEKIPSDNPIHQRLLKAYNISGPYIKGHLLELGCGQGRGIKTIEDQADQYTGIDKNRRVINILKKIYSKYQFKTGTFPPIKFPDKSFDTVIAFQVIEHIQDDDDFLLEIKRILKPKGIAILTTPNIKMSLTRNPWHVREYTSQELKDKCEKYFPNVEMKGIAGNKKVMEYHSQNRDSVNDLTKFDIFNLQHKLPRALLKIPYDLMNRINRYKLKNGDNQLVAGIHTDDFFLNDADDNNLDLFVVLRI